MAEKRVSVRLAAVGGKQVRAELEGVGDAGVKGFGRMSKEAEIANARLAAFSTRVKIAAAVAVAAAAAAGIAMIRSGLETIDAQANLAQSLGTTTRSIQVLTFAGDLAGVSMDEIAAATKKLTLKLSDAAGGTGTAVAALQRLHLAAFGRTEVSLSISPTLPSSQRKNSLGCASVASMVRLVSLGMSDPVRAYGLPLQWGSAPNSQLTH